AGICVVDASDSKADDDAYRPRRITLRHRNLRYYGHRGSTCCQPQKLTAWKFHHYPLLMMLAQPLRPEAATGHAAAAPPSVMNSRLFMCGWPPPGKRKMQRAAQKSLAVMCPACWCSPGGLLALMGSANRGLIIRAGSMSRFSASGCRRCRAAGRRADREGATLSDATYHNDCAVSCWRPNRRSGAHHGGTDESFARP